MATEHYITRLFFPIRILGIAIIGWIHILSKMSLRIWNFFGEKHGIEKVFFIVLLLQAIASGMGWIQYSIRFQGMDELIYISISWNIYFILGSVFNFFFTGFWKSRWVWQCFLLIQGLMILLLAIGSMDPGTFFTSMKSTDDYQFSPFYYVFSISLFLNFFMGVLIYWEEKKKFRNPFSSTSHEN